MKEKLVSVIMAVCLLLSMYYLARTAAKYTSTWRDVEKEKKVVVIDAGHGGDDPGKVGINGALEKEINLSIAVLVKELLEAQDVEVIMTRNSDCGLYRSESNNKKMEDLKNRLALIETSKASFALSIHQNSYTTESVYGAQVFYYETSEEGKRAAQIMQEQLRKGLDENNQRQAKGNKTYYLLKRSAVPTIIVECGFLSNGREAEMLVQKSYQEKIAWNIVMGIMQYLSGAEKSENQV